MNWPKVSAWFRYDPRVKRIWKCYICEGVCAELNNDLVDPKEGSVSVVVQGPIPHGEPCAVCAPHAKVAYALMEY